MGSSNDHYILSTTLFLICENLRNLRTKAMGTVHLSVSFLCGVQT